MKRRDTLFRATTHPAAARSIRYDDWLALTGGRVAIRRYGNVIQTGVVEMVMPDSSALWLDSDPMHDRGTSRRTTATKPGSAPAIFNPCSSARPHWDKQQPAAAIPRTALKAKESS